jgi:hypothetical protein
MEQMVQRLKEKGVTYNQKIEKEMIATDYYGAIREVIVDNEMYEKICAKDSDEFQIKGEISQQNIQQLFQFACAFGNEEICEKLIERGGILTKRTERIHTAYDCCIWNIKVASI